METVTLDPIGEAWARAWAPPDRRSSLEWLTAEVYLEGDYSQTGKFAIRDSTQFIFPLECLGNSVTRMVNVLKSPRTGGSLLGDLWLQDVFHNRPGPFLMTMQSDDDAERHYLTKNKPTFEATEANRALFAQLQKKRDLYLFPHMSLHVQGANMNSLQGKPAKYLWNAEVWLWAAGMMGQAFTRTEDFKRVCKILNDSQGALMNSEWEQTFNQGKRFNYGVKCLACHVLQPFEFFATMAKDPGERAGVVWDREARKPDGRWDIERAARSTRWRCRHCGHDHDDDLRTHERLQRGGGYVDMDPDRSMTDVSVRWTAMVGGDYHRLTKKFLQACEVRDSSGSTKALENFQMKENASFWDPSMAQQKITLTTSKEFHMEPVWEKTYKAALLEWEEARYITADYQQGIGHDTRHLLVVCRAWSDNETNRSRLLWWGRVNTFAQLHQLQLALKVNKACVMVDGSFEMMEVATQCAKYGWTMLIGDDPEYFLHPRKKAPPIRRPFSPLFKTDPLKGKTGQGRSFAWTMRWSNPSIKNLTWNLRHGLSRHKWEVPFDVPPEYRDGLDSEIKQWLPKKGSAVPVPTWTQIKRYNHPWDDECMQSVAAVAAGFITFDIEEDETPPKKEEPPKTEAPTPPHHQPDQLELLPT